MRCRRAMPAAIFTMRRLEASSCRAQKGCLVMKTFPLSKTFHLIEPGPVLLVTTAHKGQANIMTMSWHMMLEFNPPRMGCVIGPWDHSFTALRA